jgi:hypothetical protein
MVNEASLLHSKIPVCQKGKQVERVEGIHCDQQRISVSELRPSSSATPGKTVITPNHGASSSCQKEHQMSFAISAEGWEPSRASLKRRKAHPQLFNPPTFQVPVERASSSSKRNWRGSALTVFHQTTLLGSAKPRIIAGNASVLGTGPPTATQVAKLNSINPRPPSNEGLQHTSSTPHLCSYAKVVCGSEPMVARYPSDPRARPAWAFYSVTATGSIKRCRDNLFNRAMVCWLNTNSHDTECFHVGDPLRYKMHLCHG